MSRRRVSVKDLGVVDCEGWLHRRKEGRSLLGSKWKRYWFLLKKSSLYWYKDQTAEKAEGFINLCGFSIQQAKQCRKKHAITASRPLVLTLFVAAETFTDMNKWISKLSEAAETSELLDTEECYSESSDQDCDETVSASSSSSSLNLERGTESSKHIPQHLCEPPSCDLLSESRRMSTLEGAGLRRDRRRKPPVDAERLSWLDLPKRDRDGAGASIPLVHVEGEREEEVTPEMPPDEMENLYIHLKTASLSPIGQCAQRDFRASFIRRCQNDKINDKLHLLRILSSTLKAKESDLQAVDQILTDPALTAPTYRQWRLSNCVLLQEISQKNQAAGGTTEQRLTGHNSVT